MTVSQPPTQVSSDTLYEVMSEASFVSLSLVPTDTESTHSHSQVASTESKQDAKSSSGVGASHKKSASSPLKRRDAIRGRRATGGGVSSASEATVSATSAETTTTPSNAICETLKEGSNETTVGEKAALEKDTSATTPLIIRVQVKRSEDMTEAEAATSKSSAEEFVTPKGTETREMEQSSLEPPHVRPVENSLDTQQQDVQLESALVREAEEYLLEEGETYESLSDSPRESDIQETAPESSDADAMLSASEQPNVELEVEVVVEQPVTATTTGWAAWGHVEGVPYSLHGCEQPDGSYLWQLSAQDAASSTSAIGLDVVAGEASSRASDEPSDKSKRSDHPSGQDCKCKYCCSNSSNY